MGFFMYILQLFYRVMGIHLGGRQTAVTQQFLHRIQVRPMIHQVGGKTMA